MQDMYGEVVMEEDNQEFQEKYSQEEVHSSTGKLLKFLMQEVV